MNNLILGIITGVLIGLAVVVFTVLKKLKDQ